jgi:hypothetical protein
MEKGEDMNTIRWKMPDQYLTEWYRNLSGAVKTAFYAAFAAGLAAHLYQFTNKLYNYDELANTPGGIGLSTEQGRWLLNWMGRFMRSVFGGSYSLPFFNGIFALLFLALSAGMVVSVFQVRNKLTAGLIGGLMTVFPAVVSMYFFMFLALYYAIGISFSVFAAWLAVKYPKNIIANIAAVVMIACSLGVYQAYFPDTVCILLIVVILKAAFGGVKEKKEWKEFFLMIARFLVVMAAGVAVYFLINKAVLAVTHIQLTSYQGGDTMGKITIAQLISALKSCYTSFFDLGFSNVMGISYNRTVRRLIKVVWILFAAGIGAYLVLKKKEYLNKVIVLCGILVFPVAMFLIYVMAPNSYCYTLMAYSVVFFFVFFLLWLDACFRNLKLHAPVKSITNWVSALLTAALVIVFVWYANGNYMALEYTKYHDFSYVQTLVTKIRSVEDYSQDKPVIVVGTQINDSTNGMGSLIGDTFTVGGKADTNLGYNSLLYLMSDYLGFSPYYGTYEEIQNWMQREVVREMPSYPADGSIQVIDDTIIVKLSDYEIN